MEYCSFNFLYSCLPSVVKTVNTIVGMRLARESLLSRVGCPVVLTICQRLPLCKERLVC
jgi:hypothetical protein